MHCTTSCPVCGATVETTIQEIEECADQRCDDCYEKALKQQDTQAQKEEEE